MPPTFAPLPEAAAEFGVSPTTIRQEFRSRDPTVFRDPRDPRRRPIRRADPETAFGPPIPPAFPTGTAPALTAIETRRPTARSRARGSGDNTSIKWSADAAADRLDPRWTTASRAIARLAANRLVAIQCRACPQAMRRALVASVPVWTRVTGLASSRLHARPRPARTAGSTANGLFDGLFGGGTARGLGPRIRGNVL